MAKRKVAPLATLDDCQQAMRRLLLATIEVEKVTAARDEAAAAAMKPYDPWLSKAAEEVKGLEAQLQQYYMTHLADLEKDGARSVKLLYGVMGRRLSPAALRLANKSWTWASVCEAVRNKWGAGFLRHFDPEVDKDKIKAEVPAEQLGECGLKLAQDEKFFAEPDRTAEVQP